MTDDVEVRSGGDQPSESEKRGALAWMARNAVAANILMVFLVIGGLFQMCKVKKEVFPEFELDLILVNIPYPGASPEEVEKGVLLAAEEAVRGIEGVKEVRATATEGVGVLVVELLLGTDSDQALEKVQSAIDRVTSFPDPVTSEGAIAIFKASNRAEVISLAIYGDVPEQTLRELGERTRDELLQDKRITYATVAGTRPLEISVEVPQEKLRELGMTTEEIAQIIRQASVELPGGEVKTPGGNLLVRTAERRDRGEEFAEIALVSQPDGTVIRVGDVAEVSDAFAEVDAAATFNGKPAVMVKVFRTGDQSPTDVSAAVRDYIEKNQHRFPEGVEIATWFDMSEFYQDRIDLLVRNAWIGLLLVLLVLGLFLEIKLAFWVTLGIPISFIGAFFFLPSADVSINMISLFAFIVVLGMVVDDAIIVGESIYKQRQDGHSRMRAAILGCKEVALPVTFAVLTTIFAFMPMLFVPGPAGKFFRVIPIVVISVFVLSLVESLLILPAHLAHSKRTREHGVFGFVHRIQGSVAAGLERFIERVYQPILRLALRHKLATVSLALATFLVSVGYVSGGRIQQTFLPKVDSDVIIAEADLPFGAPVEASRELLALMVETANETLDEYGGDKLKRGLFAQFGAQGTGRQGDPAAAAGGPAGSHLVEVALYLVESDKRPMSGAEFSRRWREKLDKRAAGLEALRFRFATGPSGGKPVHVELSHPDQRKLEEAASVLAGKLADFKGTYDIDDGFARGKPQLDFTLTPEARSLGVTELDLARQIRSAFFGAEAVRQQRGRDEVRVYVRLPDAERDSEYHVERLMIRTPRGGEIPLAEAAEIERGRAYTEINRVDARRTMTVSSEVDLALGSADKINARVAGEVMPELTAAFPGLSWRFGGERSEQDDVNKSLLSGFAIALIGMFALLAIAFRSYLQPLIVMLAIPFGFVGALWGHVLMGYGWSLMSLMGVVALSGIVINDSLILVVAINKFYREDKLSLMEAVVAGGMRRFRPILLTSLTTFFGLAPMILETSVQARFLIPMAVSLGFGVMAATFITLLLVPAAYMILEQNLIGGWKRFIAAWRIVLGSEKARSPATDRAGR